MRMKKTIALLLCFLLLLTTAACGSPAQTQPEPPQSSDAPVPAPAAGEREYIETCNGYGYVDYVTMADGAEICCLIVKPEKEGVFPVVFTSGCYQYPVGENGFDSEYFEDCIITNSFVDDNDALVAGGYAYVMMQTRGTANSTYENFLIHERDAADEIEVLDWVREQDFYNGEIYCWGMSYMGLTSILPLYESQPDIKAIAVSCPELTRYHEWYQNGFAKIANFRWLARTGLVDGMTNRNETPWYTVMNKSMDLFNTFPIIDWPVVMYGRQEELMTGLLTHPREDDIWWQTEAPGHEIYTAIKNINVPILLYGNFYDCYYEEVFDTWTGFSDEQRAQSVFLSNQFDHTTSGYEDWPLRTEGSVLSTFTADYVADFFDSVRLGTTPANPNLKPGYAVYFPVDGTHWIAEPGTIANGTTEHVLYLNADGQLDPQAGAVSSITYTYDPNDPASFLGDDQSGELGGPEAEPNSRQDILTFLGEPVTEETYIKGIIEGDLVVSSDCADTCFYLRVDMVKDGVAYNLRADITSLVYQLGEYTPGEKVTLHFRTSPVVCRLNPGDSIRVDVTSSAAGTFSLHSNVAGNQYEISAPVVARNTVYTGESFIRFFTENLL